MSLLLFIVSVFTADREDLTMLICRYSIRGFGLNRFLLHAIQKAALAFAYQDSCGQLSHLSP